MCNSDALVLYVDEELEEDLIPPLEKHLDECHECRCTVSFFKTVTDALHGIFPRRLDS